MPKDLDEIKDMELPSSEQPALDEENGAPEKSANLVDATSSDATDETPDTLSVVRNVVDEREGDEEPASSAEGEEQVEQETAEDTPPEQDDAEYSDVPFHKHPRFQHLLREKKAAELDASRYRNIETFLESNGLAANEAADGLEIMALAKVNPAAAWERMKPWVANILAAAGEIIPDDLNQRMQRGELTREAAAELSRSRAMQQSLQARQQFEHEQAQRRQQTGAQQAIVGAAQAWENDRLQKDPDFAKKTAALQREIAYLHATEGRPATPEAVTDQCNRAYKAVNSALRATAQAPSQAQRRPAIRPVVGGQVAGNARPEPKTTLDIIRANRRAG